jgi:hypothetical protein
MYRERGWMLQNFWSPPHSKRAKIKPEAEGEGLIGPSYNKYGPEVHTYTYIYIGRYITRIMKKNVEDTFRF